MLCNRIKQFREYNKLEPKLLAESIGVSLEEYNDYESGFTTPTIDIIEKLAKCYKVTVDEFYGYTPRLDLYTNDFDVLADVPESTLKMADLSWEEKQIILHYRNLNNKDDVIKSILEKNNS